ncbi:MAG: hypothetical protein A3H25_02790 [Sphingomonadales bacterium RIFCSPLOWO2_12_FULL_63_15]|nr:MAG: hypothetical protein A3H25_02790 [Sphingomonadales bacterium RIFCSPLOWO2_12_FULL_63_15]
MPRIPQYGAPQVGPVQTTSARFRAADNDGGVAGAIGRGLQQAGGAMSDYAQAQVQIEETLAKTNADNLYLTAQSAASAALAEFKAKPGKLALDARPTVDKSLDDAVNGVLAQADPRTKRFLEPQLARLRSAAGNDIASYSIGQAKVYEQETGKAKLGNFIESAVAADDPAQRSEFIASAKAQARANAEMAGLGDPEILASEERRAVSTAHGAIVNRYLADKDIDLASAYFEAHKDNLSAGDEASLSASLAGPMQKRWAEQQFTAIAALPAIGGEPGKGGSGTPVADGGAVIKALFPQARITSTYRSKDHPLTKANPGTWHNKSKAAVDTAPIPGMTFDQYVKGVEGAGYTVIEAINETGKGRSKHATGDHWHIVLGEGGGGAVSPSARRWDMQDITQRIYAQAEKQGWSLEQRDAVLGAAKDRIGFDEQLKARQEQDADRAASEWVLKQGAGFTDLSQMPANIRGNLSPDAARSYMGVAKSNAKPVEAVANGAAATSLELLRIRDPEKFAKEPLGKYAGSVTRAEMQGLLVEQAKMNKGDPDADIRAKVAATIGTYDTPDLGFGDKDTGPVKRVRVQKLMERELIAATGGKRKPTETELYQAFISATKEVVIPHKSFLGGVSDKKFRRYEIEAENIPPNVRWQIEDAYRRKFGVTEVPEDEVAEAYQAMKAR